MKKHTYKLTALILVASLLMILASSVLTSCGGKSNKQATNATTDQPSGAVDVCKCLTEPGDSPFMIENRDACRDAISRELGVENWEKINMSQNPVVSRKFDELAARCTKSTSGNSNTQSKKDCVGNINCIEDVRRLVNGAGYKIANEKYDGEGIFYIAAYKYGPGEPIDITYVMDCNCEPVDIKIGNAARTNSSSERLHRCGRAWDGSLYEGGVYGDYCGLECYADNYPN
jgi:hypothetical protein